MTPDEMQELARAMEQGSLGQTIRVRNENSRDVLEVTVVGNQQPVGLFFGRSSSELGQLGHPPDLKGYLDTPRIEPPADHGD